MTGRREIIKHSGAIQTSGEASLLERKTWNILLLNAFDDLKKQDRFEVSISDLCRWLHFNSNDREKIKDALRNLVHTTVEWNILEKDKKGWEITTLLAGAKILDGMCVYSYNPLIKDRLSDHSLYVRLNAFENILFKGKYAEILWEQCKDYAGVGQTPWIPMDKIRKLFGIQDDEYLEFKIFFRDVIKRAVAEINRISSIRIDPKDGIQKKREKRRIVALKFIIEPNLKNEARLKKLEEKFRKEITKKEKQLQLPMGGIAIDNQDLLKTLINEFELTEKEAIEVIKNTDEFQVQENLDYVRKFRDSGKIVSSLRGYTIKAISSNYRLSKSEKRQQGKAKKETLQKKQEAEIQALNDLYQVERKTKIDTVVENFSEDQKVAAEKAFAEYIKNKSSFDYKRYQKKGLAGVPFHFQIFIGEKHLSKEDNDFILWAKKKHQKNIVKSEQSGEYELKK